MLINLWSTPRTGSNWYARKLYRDYNKQFSNVVCISELFNQNIYSYYHRNEDGRIYFLKDYSPGCYFHDYRLQDGRIVEEKVYSLRDKTPEEEEARRIELVRNTDKNSILILSNHVSPINPDIFNELKSVADRNIYLYRENVIDQIASFCVSFKTRHFISFSDPGTVLRDLNVDIRVVDNIVQRIIAWRELDKTNGEIIEYSQIDFSEYIDEGMPRAQNLDFPAINMLDKETKDYIFTIVNEKGLT